MSSYQRIPPATPAPDSTGAASLETGASFPNSNNFANSITFGAANSTGVRLGRTTSAVLACANGDVSGGALFSAMAMSTTNDRGSGSPNYASSYQTNYGFYIQNSGPHAGIVTAGSFALRCNALGQTNIRRPVVTKTAGYSCTDADTGSIFVNTGAGGQVVYVLPGNPGISDAVAGTSFTFLNTSAGAAFTKLAAFNGARFVLGGTAGSTTSPSLTSTAVWTFLTVTYLGGFTYLAHDVAGTWTLV